MPSAPSPMLQTCNHMVHHATDSVPCLRERTDFCYCCGLEVMPDYPHDEKDNPGARRSGLTVPSQWSVLCRMAQTVSDYTAPSSFASRCGLIPGRNAGGCGRGADVQKPRPGQHRDISQSHLISLLSFSHSRPGQHVHTVACEP